MQKRKHFGTPALLAVCLLLTGLCSCARQEAEQKPPAAQDTVGSLSNAALPEEGRGGAAQSASAKVNDTGEEPDAAPTRSSATASASQAAGSAQAETDRKQSAAAGATEAAATGMAKPPAPPFPSAPYVPAPTQGMTRAEPPAAPTKPQAPESAGNGRFLTEFEAKVVTLVNRQRAQNGLSPLAVTASLRDTAHLRAEELTQTYSHTRPDGTPCFTAFPKSSAAGENVARGQQSPEAVIESWMGSEAHRQNILNPAFTRIAVGCIRANNTLYWVQCFTGE